METIKIKNINGEEVEVSKKKILGYISDGILDFLSYDRRSDEDLPEGSIEKAIKEGIITIDEMATEFKAKLIEAIEEGVKS